MVGAGAGRELTEVGRALVRKALQSAATQPSVFHLAAMGAPEAIQQGQGCLEGSPKDTE